MVKNSEQAPSTAAIGDGGNDVAMIQVKTNWWTQFMASAVNNDSIGSKVIFQWKS